MSTTAEELNKVIAKKLNKVVESKSAIKTAITNKGGIISDSTPFSQYATIISELPESISGVTYSDNTLFISKSDVDINVISPVQNININSGGEANIVNGGGTITADNLSAGNIKSGVNILGVAGTYETPTETKSVTPIESLQTITPSTGKHLSKITVEAIPNTYIGSAIPQIVDDIELGIDNQTTRVNLDNTLYIESDGNSSGWYMSGGYVVIDNIKVPGNFIGDDIAKRDSSSVSKSGGTITIPAGYYATAVSKSVSVTDLGYSQATSLSGSRSGTTYTVSIGANKYTSNSLSTQVTPSTLGLTAQAAKTVAPTESEQTVVTSGAYTTGAVKVGAISATYVGSGIYNGGIEPDAKAVTYWRANDSVPYYLYVYVPNYLTGDGYEKALITRGMKVHSENFGNAKQNQVLKGATFTSESGLKIAGTIETKTSLSKSGGTVTASAGYYASNVSSTVSVGDLGYTQATSLGGSRSGTTYTVNIDANKYTSSNLSLQVTPSTLGLSQATALGGSLSGTTYTVSIDANKYTSSKLTKDVNPGTLGLTAKGGTTITPSTTVQTAIPANYYATGDIKVAAMPIASFYGETDNTGIPLIRTAGYVNSGTRLSKCYINPGNSLRILHDDNSDDGGSITVESLDVNGASYGPDLYFKNSSSGATTKLAEYGDIIYSQTGTSESGFKVSLITAGDSGYKYINVTEGYTTAKYWQIDKACKKANIGYQPYRNIIKPTVTNCQYWTGQQSPVNGIFPLFYFNGVTEAFVGSKKIPSNGACKIGQTTTASNNDYQTTDIWATCTGGKVYFGPNSSTTSIRVPHKGDERGSSASYGMTLIYAAPLIFIKNSNFSSTPVVTAVYKTWNHVNGITTVGGTYSGNYALTEKIVDNVSSNSFFYPGYISFFGLDGNNTLQINVDSNNGTLD